MKALIVTGGTIGDVDKCFFSQNFNVIVGVDGGIEYLLDHSMEADYYIGDFDTVSEEIYSKLDYKKIIKFNPDKNQTDTELSVDYCIKLGCNEVVILGGIGSRFDHSLANYNLLYKCLINGVDSMLINSNNTVLLVDRAKKLSFKIGSTVSLIPYTETVEGVSIEGFKYELLDFTLCRCETLGVSNVVTSNNQSIVVKKGVLAVIKAKD